MVHNLVIGGQSWEVCSCMVFPPKFLGEWKRFENGGRNLGVSSESKAFNNTIVGLLPRTKSAD
jgi:hypothetical protein